MFQHYGQVTFLRQRAAERGCIQVYFPGNIQQDIQFADIFLADKTGLIHCVDPGVLFLLFPGKFQRAQSQPCIGHKHFFTGRDTNRRP